ncbi:MAG: hypothetical protein ACR2RE_19320, partial [Geminicoccaceae bacterium]
RSDIHHRSRTAADDGQNVDLDDTAAFHIASDGAGPATPEECMSGTTKLVAFQEAFDRAMQTMKSSSLTKIRFETRIASGPILDVSVKQVSDQLHVVFAVRNSSDLLILQTQISGLAALLQERYQRHVEIRTVRRRGTKPPSSSEEKTIG